MGITATVERAGVCSEGDNCPRFHCTACGAYWLSDSSHVCPSTASGLERAICRGVDEQLGLGYSLDEAARQVSRHLVHSSLAVRVVEVFGAQLVVALWHRQHPSVSPHTATRVPSVARKAATPTRPKHLDLELFASPETILESLIRLDGKWLRLGDLDRAQCHRLARLASAQGAFFDSLGAALGARETVRQRWPVADLRGLLADLGAPRRSHTVLVAAAG